MVKKCQKDISDIDPKIISMYAKGMTARQISETIEDNGVIRKLAAYVILGINTEGEKEVLAISVGDNESTKYWLSVMNELKNRGIKDVLVICADGLT